MEVIREILQTILDTVLSVLPEGVTLEESLLQAGLAAALCLGAWLISRRMHPAIVEWCESRPRWESARRALEPLIWPVAWLVFLSLLLGLFVAIQQDTWLQEILTSLLVAWIVVRTVSRAIRNPVLSRVAAVIAYGMAVLSIFDMLGPTITILDSFKLELGKEFSLSLYEILTTALLLAVLISLASFASRVTERRLRDADWVTPTGRVLLNKTIRIGLFVFAILISISTAGIDLTALAVIGGAVGFGIGFGLQKVFSNLISGLILLMDKSIKPGDVITVENTYGWVNKLGARYVSIITRDGIEHLIPNETMITEPVSNWTHSDANTRLRIPIGVHYETDLELATRLGVEAAQSQSRVLGDPAPRCLVKGFGESAIDLEIRFWIQDADSGVSNIKSAVILEVWRLYQEHGIRIPYPQRDLHIKSGEISQG
ncbi:MAG: mechanosensitive ion channel [Gammaproteobacteria bacterium]|nr:mechanosensitive ion channel [Gammaproteobacteria bacterium]MXW44529.1 mechanosensitive ion channel [Gammaproteobacteria bacterium]MYD01370.1 mechanosensitive ion channel [Gammaproteobacteria bacterium]MYI24690.1 mechanosensitive ion channel [Gammaproteobacteria bacterium]